VYSAFRARANTCEVNIGIQRLHEPTFTYIPIYENTTALCHVLSEVFRLVSTWHVPRPINLVWFRYLLSEPNRQVSTRHVPSGLAHATAKTTATITSSVQTAITTTNSDNNSDDHIIGANGDNNNQQRQQ
jgi:hypothetical protein